MTKVNLFRGVFDGRVIQNKEFKFIRGMSKGQSGFFITVNGEGYNGYPQRNFRISVSSLEDFELDDTTVSKVSHTLELNPERNIKSGSADLHDLIGHGALHFEERTGETDAQIRERINERFEILKDLTTDAARSNLKGLVVWGSSGMGKSFEIGESLDKEAIIDKLKFNPNSPDPKRIDEAGEFKPRHRFIKGFSTPAALYQTLYDSKEKGEVLVFDDCDNIYGDEIAMNLLKGCLDTTKRRIISWNSTRPVADYPSSFEFQASVIFITNINFERIIAKGSSKMIPHLQAIMDRCLCLDLTIDTIREKMIRIEQVSRDLKMLEDQYNLTPDQVEEVIKWTKLNLNNFRDVSLRKIGQLANIRTGNNANWQRVAAITLLKTSASR